MVRLNCWQFKKCGRGPGGDKVAELGLCPAATETKLDGVNYGDKAGRACWALVGTNCHKNQPINFALHLSECSKCDFYQLVYEQEDWNYHDAKAILKKLNTA